MCVIAGTDRDKSREGGKKYTHQQNLTYHSAISDKIYSRYVF